MYKIKCSHNGIELSYIFTDIFDIKLKVGAEISK